MNRKDIDILEVGNAYTALFTRRITISHTLWRGILTRIPTHGIRVIIFVT